MALFKRKIKDDKKDQSKKVDKVKDEKKEKSKEVKKDVKKVKKEDLKKTHGDAYKQLVRPIITEKSAFVGMYNQYMFEVAAKTNKVEVKKAIQALYDVTPIKINTVNMRGKMVRYGRKYGQLKNWKKAVVILKQGDKIDVYEGV